MAFVQVVKMDFRAGEFVKKYHVARNEMGTSQYHKDEMQGEIELGTWSQLVVSETQQAIMRRGGSMDGPFGPGTHTLDTNNIPIISKVLNLPFGGRSPFTSEIWFVNTATAINSEWYTDRPFTITDREYQNVRMQMLARGSFGVKIVDARRIMTTLVGDQGDFHIAQVEKSFRGIAQSIIKQTLVDLMVSKNISFLDISANLIDISESMQKKIEDRIAEFGLKLVNFAVESIEPEANDPGFTMVQNALAETAAIAIKQKGLGYTYQQEKSFEVLKEAAKNDGAGNMGSSLMQSGMGLGMGLGLGQQFGTQMQQMAQNINVPPSTPSAPVDNSFETKARQIKALAELKEQGLLTEDEFAIEKKKILQS